MRTKFDSSAIVHTALMNDNTINNYRISITMKEEVDADRLQKAVDLVAPRYPMIVCRVVNGSSWIYSQPLETIAVKEDDHRILKSLDRHNIYNQAINIMYSGNKVVFEAFHSVTDGFGAFTFLNNLLREYIAMADSSYQLPCLGKASETEMECAFTKYGTASGSPENIVSVKKPFYFDKLDYSRPLRFTTVRMNLRQVKDMAKSNGWTINELMLGMIYSSVFTLPNTDGRDVLFSVPVNMRNKFESRSLRNFSYLTKTALRKKAEYSNVSSIIHDVRNQLARQNNKEYLHKALSQVKHRFDGPLTANLPLWLKNLLIRAGVALGFDKSCMTVSNVGNLAYLLPDIHQHILGADTMMSPRRKSRYNCCISSLLGNLNMTFTHSEEDDPLLNAIGSWLRENNIEYVTESH